MKKRVFIKNAAVLTCSSLVLRFAGIVFKIWLASRIGAAGMGLYQLVFSVFMLAGSFTQSGIPTAVTRLVANETALGSRAGIKRIMRAAFFISTALGAVTGIILYFFASPIARLITGDSGAVLSLKIIASCFVFMGASSVIRGYFIARRKASPGAFAQLFEQAVRITVAAALLKVFIGKGPPVCCAAVFAGDAAAETFCAAFLYFRYRKDSSDLPEGKNSYEKNPAARIVSVSLPLAGGRYLNSLLRTAESLLVPHALAVFSAGGALAVFGMIKGMALPILFFPSVLLGAVSVLMIPEMSEARERKMNGLVRSCAESILAAGAVGGFLFSALFAAGGYRLGALLYKSREVGFLLTALAPIVPLMYIDSLCDGLLKGLDQQKFTFRVSVCDSGLRLLLIYPCLTRFGINGFIGIMYFSNLFTALLNSRRLIKISGAVLDAQRNVLSPALCAFGTTLLTKVFLDFFALSDLVYIILLAGISIPLYYALVYRLGCMQSITAGRIRPLKKYAAKRATVSLIK
ncbi:MAG: oligosaccharide flippase family protein [Clostridia bacterium]|nr:oligosaccharide flippase family protein [Clostridia bacterium]